MPPAEFDQTTVTIAAPTKDGDAIFRASGRKLVFDGFMKVAGISSEDQLLPALAENQQVYPIQVDPTQHLTQPPPRFSEASLVKELEKQGIGRPSTYASIIQTIDYDKIDTTRGMDITIVTTARTDGEGRALLDVFGFPFRRDGQQA